MKTTTILLSLVSVLVLSSCEVLKKMEEEDMKRKNKDKAQYVLSVHQIVKFPMAKNIEHEVKTFSGRKIWINMNPFLHSRDIKRIELIPREDNSLDPDNQTHKYWKKGAKNKHMTSGEDLVKEPQFYDLKLYLTRRGSLEWMQLSAGFRHEKLALLIDGIFYRTFTPQRMFTEDDEYAILEGPIDETCAKMLRKHAPSNFNSFNDLKKSNFGTFSDFIK